MKTQLSKPARIKARYTEEYKQEALELSANAGLPRDRKQAGGIEHTGDLSSGQ